MTKTNYALFMVMMMMAGLIAGLVIQRCGGPETHSIDRMPLVLDDPFATSTHGGLPDEQRGPEVRQWLMTGLKIQVSGASGSGTIVYYNPEDKWAYVQSCGHLWNGNMSGPQGLAARKKCKVETWYQNDNKLSSTKTYDAEVLFYSNTDGADCSLIRFQPDWEPEYAPIGAQDFVFTQGMVLHSVGCDGGREIAHYLVEVVGMRKDDLVTTRNSPRPGRSGGGLISDEGYYVGICWGTTSFTGDGNGFFTPLATIRRLNEQNGYGWLNDAGTSIARRIPIKDRNNPQAKYPKDYIPLPSRR